MKPIRADDPLAQCAALVADNIEKLKALFSEIVNAAPAQPTE